MSDKNQQQGAVLLIALLIIAGLTAVGLGVSVIIFSNLRATSLVDNNIAGVYAAESGIERSLEQVFEGRSDGASLGTEPCGATDTVICNIKLKPQVVFPNGARWNTSTSTALTDTLLLDAAEGQSAQLDLFDPGDETAGFGNIEKIRVTAVPSTGWAEISWVAWDGNAFISNSRTVLINPTDLGNGKTLDLYGTGDVNDPIFNALTSGHQLRAFRVNVKARFGDLNDITIQALRSDGTTAVLIPNRVYIKSRGSSGGTSVALTASIPWRLPTSSLFDFVLFSDESIEK